MVAQESNDDCSAGPSPPAPGTAGYYGGEYPIGERSDVKELNNNCVRNLVSLQGKDAEKLQYLNSGEEPRPSENSAILQQGIFDFKIVSRATTNFCPEFVENMEERAEKKKKRFRPVPGIQSYTTVDFVHSKPSHGEYFTYQSKHLDGGALRYCEWEWDEKIELLADECAKKVLKARKCFSTGSKSCGRPRQGNKAIRAQKQIAEKQFRSKNILQNTGGHPVKTVVANSCLVRKNKARELHLADCVAAKKANIEKRLVALKLERRGPPNNFSDATVGSSCPPGKPTTSKPVKFELKEGEISHHASDDEEAQLLKVMVLLQGRDLLPEDYDLLLRLDEKVSRKTVGSNLLKSLRTKLLTLEDVSGDCEVSELAGAMCAICMECYCVDEVVKWLPCEHVFHKSCIDKWLSMSGSYCPLDGLEV